MCLWLVQCVYRWRGKKMFKFWEIKKNKITRMLLPFEFIEWKKNFVFDGYDVYTHTHTALLHRKQE